MQPISPKVIARIVQQSALFLQLTQFCHHWTVLRAIFCGKELQSSNTSGTVSASCGLYDEKPLCQVRGVQTCLQGRNLNQIENVYIIEAQRYAAGFISCTNSVSLHCQTCPAVEHFYRVILA